MEEEEKTVPEITETYDPILISIVRESLPNLMAYDICGVQPMTGPTGAIFGMRPVYDKTFAKGMQDHPNASMKELEDMGYGQ